MAGSETQFQIPLENQTPFTAGRAEKLKRVYFAVRQWLSTKRLVDFIFGYDYFISYKQDDGRNYPRQLAASLKAEGFRVFLDETGYTPGDDLLFNTKRRVRMSSYLILIARPGALTRSEWVIREVNQSIDSGNTPIIVDINAVFLTLDPKSDQERTRLSKLRQLLRNRLRLPETVESGSGIYDGSPSTHVVSELKRSFTARRQDTRRALAFGITAAVLSILLLIAISLAIASVLARQKAESEARRSRSGELAAQANMTRQPQLAALLGTEAVRVVNALGEPVPATAKQALTDAAIGLTGEGIPGFGAELGSLDVSPDGSRWVSGSDDGKVRIWKAATDGRLNDGITLTVPGNENVRFAAFSASSDWLVTAGDAGEGCFWSLSDLQNSNCLPMADSAFLLDVSISPDRRWIAAAENKDRVLLWDLAKAKPAESMVEIGQQLETVRYIKFSHDGRWLIAWAIGSNDFWLWDLYKNPVSHEPIVLRAHQSSVSNVAVDPTGRKLASIDEKGGLYLWQLDAGVWLPRQLNAARRDPVVINGLIFGTSGRWLASATSPGLPQDESNSTISIWYDLQGKPQLKNISLDGAVRNIDDSPTDNLLYVEGFNGSLWSMNITGDMDTSPARMPEHRSTVTQHAFSSDSRFLATGDNENKVVLWDLRCKGSPAPIALTGHEGAIRTLQFVGNDHWLVSTSDDGTARRWDIGRSLPKNSLLLSNSCRGELETSRLSVDGRWLASGTAGGSVLLYDLASVDPSANALELGTDKKSPIKQIWFDPANKWLFASQGNLLHVWDLAASSIETSRRDIGPLQEDVKSLSVTAASRFLVVSWYGGNALITDLTQTDLTANAKSINFPDEKIDIVDLSPDGRWLAATSYDRLAIWDLSKSGGGLPVPVIFPAVESFIQAIHFTRDSKRVMTVSNSGRLSTWEMPIKSDRPSLVVDLADRASDVTFSENDRWIAVSTTVAPHLRMFLLDGTADTPTYIVPKGSSENNGSVALSKDGRWLAYASYRGAIQVWETSHLDAEPWVVAASFPQIGRIGFSNDGNWLAIGSELGDVSSVEMTEAGPLNPVSTRHHQDSVQFVGFSAHNRWLISQSASELRLTPLTTSELLELAARGLGRNFSPIEWSTYFAGQAYRKTIERLPAITLDPTNK